MEIKEFFFKKVDVLMRFCLLETSGRMLKQIMEIKDFFFKKGDENFVWKNIEMFFKGEFCC